MSDAIKKLHDYLAKSPSVIYPEDALAYLPAIEAENARLREQIHWLKRGDVLHVLTDQELAEQQKREREMQASITALDEENVKLRERLTQALQAIELCTGELLRFKGVPYIIMPVPVGIEQALMESVATVVGKRYEDDLSGFYDPKGVDGDA